MPSPASDSPPEERYEIVGRIAAGGMAEIYLARTVDASGRELEVVLKRLMPELQSDQEFVQMFYDEANIASQLRHPSIVHIFELGELDGSLFISMEFLRGVNLRDLLARIHDGGQKLPFPHALRIASDCLAALHYAHEFADEKGRRLNVVHRDVSPQNIIVTYDGQVKLVDFGVAKAEGRLHQTRAGLVKGKFAYMSPEQITGAAVDGRSDLFALAEVFYELLLRRHPFYANTDMDVLRAILDADPPHPTEIDKAFPRGLAKIFLKALAKKPGDRYAHAGDMQDAIETLMVKERMSLSTPELGDFISDLFRDRLDLERDARDHGDDDLLIDAMQAGRIDNDSESGINEVAQETGDIDPGAVVKYDGPSAPDPAEPVLSDAGTTGRRRLRSEVRGLFSEDEEPAGDALPAGAELPEEDAAEMPTILGNFTPDQLQEVRQAAQEARDQRRQSKSPSHSPAAVPAVSRAPTHEPRGPVVSRRKAPVASVSDPAEASGAQVTNRSATIVKTDDPSTGLPKKSKASDRIGLLFFLIGLGALIGAVIYAVQLLSAPKDMTMSLIINSAPPGAAIILDGNDTGAKTPQTIPSLPSDRQHIIELRLDGYSSYEQKLTPVPHLDELEINAQLRQK